MPLSSLIVLIICAFFVPFVCLLCFMRCRAFSFSHDDLMNLLGDRECQSNGVVYGQIFAGFLIYACLFGRFVPDVPDCHYFHLIQIYLYPLWIFLLEMFALYSWYSLRLFPCNYLPRVRLPECIPNCLYSTSRYGFLLIGLFLSFQTILAFEAMYEMNFGNLPPSENDITAEYHCVDVVYSNIRYEHPKWDKKYVWKYTAETINSMETNVETIFWTGLVGLLIVFSYAAFLVATCTNYALFKAQQVKYNVEVYKCHRKQRALMEAQEMVRKCTSNFCAQLVIEYLGDDLDDWEPLEKTPVPMGYLCCCGCFETCFSNLVDDLPEEQRPLIPRFSDQDAYERAMNLFEV